MPAHAAQPYFARDEPVSSLAGCPPAVDQIVRERAGVLLLNWLLPAVRGSTRAELYRRIRHVFGTTPGKHVAELRLTEAARLLAGGCSVTETSLRVGFESIGWPDIHAAYELLLSRSVEFRGKPHPVGKLGSKESWMAFFHDSELNLLAIMSEVEVG